MFCRNSIFHNTLQLHLDSIFREPRPPSAVPASLRRELSAALAGCEARPHGAGSWFSINSLRKRVTPHRPLEKLGPLPHGGSPRPLPLPAEPALSTGLATALATPELLPLVSPGKRSAAARRDQGRARTLGSGGAEDAWSCARTRGLCRSESHSDSSCGSQRFCGDRGLAAARQLREWTLLGRAPAEVLLGVACEWGPGPCAAASIFKILWALWGKGVQIFPQKKFLFLVFFGTPNNYFQCSPAQGKSVQAKLVH